jgi:hypothetical protein
MTSSEMEPATFRLVLVAQWNYARNSYLRGTTTCEKREMFSPKRILRGYVTAELVQNRTQKRDFSIRSVNH